MFSTQVLSGIELRSVQNSSQRKVRFLWFAALCATLAACGGTGGTSSDDPAASPLPSAVPTVSIQPQSTINEDSSQVQIGVALSEASDSEVSVDYTTSNGSALAGVDFEETKGVLIFSPGVVELSIIVEITDDNLDESSEEFSVILESAENANLEQSSAVIVIEDNDSPQALPSISLSSSTFNESVGTIDIALLLSAPSSTPVSVTVSSEDSSATVSTDFESLELTVEFPPNSTFATFPLTILEDTEDESDENLIINLASPVGATIATPTANVTITDNDDASGGAANDKPSLSGPNVYASEANGILQITLFLSEAASVQTSVGYETVNGAAMAGLDYQSVSGSVVFPAGSTSQTVSINLIDDALYEAEESFLINLTRPLGLSLDTSSIVAVIRNDDSLPAVSIASTSVSESSATANLVVTLDRPSGAETSLTFATEDISAVAGQDYTPVTGTLIFAAGVSTRTILIPMINDSVQENAENFRVRIASPINASLVNSAGQVTIADDDTAGGTPSVAASDIQINENVNAATFMLTLSSAPQSSVNVSYATANDSATAGSDYESRSGTVTFDAGVTSQSVVVPIVNDTLVEGLERFQLSLSSNDVGVGTPNVVASIIDDDQLQTLPSLSVSNATTVEPDDMTFTLLLSRAVSSAVSIDVITVDSTAVAGSDYQAYSSTVVIPAGATTGQVVIQLLDDSEAEENEVFQLQISSADAQVVNSSVSGTIIDDDSVSATPTITISDASGSEGVGNLVFNVSLSQSATNLVSYSFSTAQSSASSGSDYFSRSGNRTIAIGSTMDTIVVPIVDNLIVEPDEVFLVNLNNVSNATVGDGQALGSIIDDDQAPSISIGNRTVSEAIGTVQLTVSLSNAAGATVTFDFATANGTATAGQDYTGVTGSGSIPAGQTSTVISIPIVNDQLASEGTETFSIAVSNVSNASGSPTATVSITDNDNTPILSAANLTIDESVGNAQIVVSIDAATNQTVTFSYQTQNGTAVAGQDFSSTSSTGSIPAGQTSTAIAIPIIDDATSGEGTEQFSVMISNVSNASGSPSAAVSITDNDSTPVVVNLSVADASAAEGDSGSAVVSIVVSLSSASSSDVQVNYATSNGSATAGSDYTATQGNLLIDAGDTLGSINIPILGDTQPESVETFSLALSNPVGATITDGNATITITDNDSAQLALTSRPSNTSCLAPAPTTTTTGGGSGSFQLTNVFPNLPTITQVTKFIQPPNSSSQWFALRQPGQLYVFDNTSSVSSSSVYLDFSSRVTSGGEMGALGLAFHPNWPATKHLFIYYTNGSGASRESRVSRLIVNDSSLPATYTEEQILRVVQPGENHNGGDIVFGSDGLLYIGLGDGGTAGFAQQTTALRGSMLRIDVANVSYPTPGYNIPSGNPFAGGSKCGATLSGSNCPEIYAWGLRNPWRWSFDSSNGDMWVADVGQDTWEEVNKVVLGGNYGWSCREGDQTVGTFMCGSNLLDPVHQYPHTNGNRSISGGFVYRGGANASLVGQYIFADFSSGRIWRLPNAGGSSTEMFDTSYSISGFGQDNAGELYAVDYAGGRFYRIDETGGGGSTTITVDNVPNSLADTGCVQPGNPTQASSGLVPYSVAAPFWSDNAVKDRWIALPNGASITANANNDWSFPPGTVIMKNFSLANQLIETRLLMRHPAGDWAGYTYEWNNAETAATRVENGKTRSVNGQTWVYPSEDDCLGCHTTAAGFALGPETAQFNSDFQYPSSGITSNQLEVFNHIDMFAVDVPEPVSNLPALVDPTDTSANLEDRVRSYLHTNCAQCHQPGGPSGSAMDLRYSTATAATGTCNVVPGAGTLGIANARIIAPGEPSRSVLINRMNRRDSEAMPPVGSTVVDTAGVALLTDWVNSLSSCP